MEAKSEVVFRNKVYIYIIIIIYIHSLCHRTLCSIIVHEQYVDTPCVCIMKYGNTIARDGNDLGSSCIMCQLLYV